MNSPIAHVLILLLFSGTALLRAQAQQLMVPAVAVRTLMQQKSEAPWENYIAKVAMYLDVQQYQ